jgi:hypothetical protein
VDRRARLEVHVLVQQAELHVTSAHDIAAIRSFITSDETKDRTLARAVSADEPNMFAGIYLQSGTAQNILRAIGFINVRETKQHLRILTQKRNHG